MGFRSFRYDMKEPQMSRQHLALFRRALALHAGVTLAKETQCEVGPLRLVIGSWQ